MKLQSLTVSVVTIVLMLSSIPASADDACGAEARAFDRTDPALAPPADKRAAQHVREGNRRHRVLKYAEAIEQYIAGALLDSAPSIHYNLGQSYRLSGQYENAIRQYRLFLDRGQPRPGVRALVECHIASMTAELQRAAATAPPTGPAPDGDAASDPSQPAVARTNTATVAPLEASAPRDEPWYDDRVGLGIAGAGIIATGIGAWLLVDAGSLYDEASREDRDHVRTELRADADKRQTWGIVTTAVGGAALVAGVVKLAIKPNTQRSQSRPDDRGVSLQWSPAGLALHGRF
jgi:tetratricopeptide (TPR) repeat protein